VSVYDSYYRYNSRDQWFIVEQMLAGKRPNAIPTPDYYADGFKGGPSRAWDLAWAKWLVAYDNESNNQRIRYMANFFDTATQMRAERPNTNYLSVGKGGGVVFRTTAFPMPPELPSLEDWLKIDNNALRGSSIKHICGRLCHDDCERTGIIQYNTTYSDLRNGRNSSNALCIYDKQIKIDKDIPIPNGSFVVAYLELHLSGYNNVKTRYEVALENKNNAQARLANWSNESYIDNYIKTEVDRCWRKLKELSQKEGEAKKALDKAKEAIK